MTTPELIKDLERHFRKLGPLTVTETTKSWVFLTEDTVFKAKNGCGTFDWT